MVMILDDGCAVMMIMIMMMIGMMMMVAMLNL